MGDSGSEFSFYLVFGDITYGVTFKTNITYDDLVLYVKKKYKFNDASDVMFSYKIGSRCVHVVDDDDVKFFAKQVCGSKGTEHTLFIKRFEKCSNSKASSSKKVDFDLNVPLFSYDSKFVKNETFENNDKYKDLWKKNTLEYIPSPPNPQPVINTPLNIGAHTARVFKKGDRYDSQELLKFEISFKCILEGYQFKTRKSDPTRYDVICKNDDCAWKIITSKCPGSSKWVVGKVHDHHTCPKTQIGMHHRNATAKMLGRLIASRFKDNSRVYKGKDIKHDIYMDFNIDITYKQAWRAKNVALETLSGCPIASFAQLPYFCHNLELINDGTVTHIETDNEDRFQMVFIAFGVVIRSFKNHMRPLIIIDAAHLKGVYKGTNLLAVGMDGNNQIIPIATGVSQSENGPSWTWFLTNLKECIGEVPNLTIISDRHAAIKSSCEAVFPNAFHAHCCRHLMMNCRLKGDYHKKLFWKTCKAYSPEEFNMAMLELGQRRPDAYQKLIDAGVEKWSRAYCPNDRYNYMTSNSAESINNLTKDVRKIPITNLMMWYYKLVQKWYFERREKYRDAPLNSLSDWATAKITKRMQKSVNWSVVGVEMNRVYAIYDCRGIHTVEFFSRTCTCKKWQLSGLPCGHVLAACRTMGITDSASLAQEWFMRKALEATYQELVYPMGEVSSWQCPNYLQVVKPPLMDKKQSGRPKSTARIRSQGEEPLPTRCGRCGARGHNRTSCRETIPQQTQQPDHYQPQPQEDWYNRANHYQPQPQEDWYNRANHYQPQPQEDWYNRANHYQPQPQEDWYNRANHYQAQPQQDRYYQANHYQAQQQQQAMSYYFNAFN